MSNETSTSTTEALNTVVGSVNLYSGKVLYQYFNYNVDSLTALIFVGVFGLSTLIHLGECIKSKHWFLLYTLVLGGLIETLGWLSRYWAGQAAEWAEDLGGYWASPRNAFLFQIIFLIIGPAFLAAANYILLGRLIERLGQRYCRLGYKTYTGLFITGDLISLVVQALGGAMASMADDTAGADSGARIMVIGVIWQMIVMLAFTWLLCEFIFRYLKDRPVRQIHPFARTRNARARIAEIEANGGHCPAQMTWGEERRAKWMLVSISGSTLLIFIRSIYRTIELLDGWTGPLISNQGLFNWLDGVPIALSLILLNILHPVFLLPLQPRQKNISSPMDYENNRNSHYISSSQTRLQEPQGYY